MVVILQQETQWEWQSVLFDGRLLVDPVLTGEKERVKKFELADAAARHMMIRIATLMLHEQRELRLQGWHAFTYQETIFGGNTGDTGRIP